MKQLMRDLKQFKYFFKNCKKEIIMFTILAIIVCIITVVIPNITGIMINNLLAKEFKVMIIFFIISSLLQVLNVILNIIITKYFLSIRKKMIFNIRKHICFIALNLNLEVFQIYGQGNFLNKIQSDTGRISNYFNVIKEGILTTFSNLGTLVVILFLNPIIGIYFILCCFISFYVRYRGIKKSLYYKNKNLKSLDENSTILGQMYKGAKDIKTLNLKKSFETRTSNSFEDIGELEYKSIYYYDYANKIAKFMESSFLGGMLLLSMFLIKWDLLTTSTFIIILMNRGKVFGFTAKLSSLINNFGQFKLSLERILSILDYDREVYGNKKIDKYNGNIELKDISFSYGDKKIFDNFNLKIKKNTFNMILGNNGSGKTTLFSLITKVYTPKSGNIYLDNYAMDELDEDSIRNNISLVTQQPFLFNLSIKENLEIIDKDFNHIKKVCEEVGLKEKIESLDKGYDTILNEDATNFSGGEKQRLAIARALLTNTKVLLLDEITNNLDKNAINSIKDLILKLKGKYTIIMITHDLEFAKNGDRIIILDKGKIVGDDTHNNLLKSNSYYKKINGLKK